MSEYERDLELEWLKELNEEKNGQKGRSYRQIGLMLKTHHESVRIAITTDRLGDTLRGRIRAYWEDHPDGSSDEGLSGLPSEEKIEIRQTSTDAGTDDQIGVESVGPDESSPRQRQPEDAEAEQVARQDLLDEIVACETVQEVAGMTARIRARQLGVAYDKRQAQTFSGHLPLPLTPYYLDPRPATLDDLKTYAIALLMETPVLKELPLAVAVGAARVVLNGEVSLLNPPPGVYGDALVLLLTQGEAHYWDEGAREVALSAAGKVFACGLSAEEIRDGVGIEDRMRRYACDDHWDRPLMIGTRLSDVIPSKAYPDEPWFFGSPGFVDEYGVWQPGRGELIALWRHVSSLCEDWNAGQLETPWQHALVRERTDLEVTLLSEPYRMTFDREILGEARWPTSTRLGLEMQVRLSEQEANRLMARKQFRRRPLRTLLLWPLRLPLRALSRSIFILRRDLADPDGYTPAGLPRIRERVMPGLYKALDEQRWPTKVLSWILYRRHSNFDGSVSGRSDWTVTDPPMTADYMTPHPVSGYVPSGAFRLRFRSHEFEPGFRTTLSGSPSRHWIARATRAARRLMGMDRAA